MIFDIDLWDTSSFEFIIEDANARTEAYVQNKVEAERKQEEIIKRIEGIKEENANDYL